MNLEISDEVLEPVHRHGHDGTTASEMVGKGRAGLDGAKRGGRREAAVAEAIADEHGVPISAVEKVAEALETER